MKKEIGRKEGGGERRECTWRLELQFTEVGRQHCSMLELQHSFIIGRCCPPSSSSPFSYRKSKPLKIIVPLLYGVLDKFHSTKRLAHHQIHWLINSDKNKSI